MIGVVWVGHRGNVCPTPVKGDRMAVLIRAAQTEAYSEDYVTAVEYTAEDGSWVVLDGSGPGDSLWDAVEEGRRAWREQQWAARKEQLKTFVPQPMAAVYLLPPGVAGVTARPADWELLESFTGDGAEGRARELVAQLGLPVFRVKIETGETKA